MTPRTQRVRAPLRMYWWRPDPPYRGNFGDELGPYLVDALFGRRVEWAKPDACEIATVGTVIEMMLSSKSQNRPALWGSGLFLTAGDTISADEFEIAALRGRLTRERIVGLDSDVALGDPGLLAFVLVETLPRKRHALGIVPHFLDAGLPLVAELRTRPGVTIVDVTKPAPEVVRDIGRCQYVLSSSLHGLVVADSIGIPNAYVALSNDPRIGGAKKFLDYYSVFTDPARQVVLPLTEVMSRDIASITSEIERRYRAPSDLRAIADRLINAFPS